MFSPVMPDDDHTFRIITLGIDYHNLPLYVVRNVRGVRPAFSCGAVGAACLSAALGLLLYLVDDGKCFCVKQRTFLCPLFVEERANPPVGTFRQAFLAAPTEYHTFKFKDAAGLSCQLGILLHKLGILLLKLCFLLLKLYILTHKLHVLLHEKTYNVFSS